MSAVGYNAVECNQDDFETEIIERQRIAIEMLLEAIRAHVTRDEILRHEELWATYLQVSEMTAGTSEHPYRAAA